MKYVEDREYVQHENESSELVIWEEWISWARGEREAELSQLNIEDTSCGDSQRRKPLTN
jgi:hypothetical protein